MRKLHICRFFTSVLMSVLLVMCSFTPYVHAEYNPDTMAGDEPSETERIYERDGYKVTFSLVSSWSDGYNLNIVIDNTGSDTIQNWHLAFDYAGDITNIWSAEIEEITEDGYVVKNAGYNMDIAPGTSMDFGISENMTFPGFPESVVIPAGDTTPVSGDHSIVYTVEDDWGVGFVGNICITNNTDTTINDWSLEFDFSREIISVWGAVIESAENGHYIVRHAVDNPDILPGQSVSFGMMCSGDAISDEPENYNLTSYLSGEVRIDDPDADMDGDGLSDSLEEAIGTDPELADTDGDGLSDHQELYLTWTDPLLTDTDDDGISDAYEDLDGDGLGNLDELMRGTDTGNPDTDRDDLSDYAEIYEYGTDPLNPDSDADTLSDGDDVLLGFSPLLPDTDNNGILDCNEIVYQTTENDFPLGDGRGITNVSVSMNVSGNIEKEVGILNMYDFDVQSREVVGIVGVPVDIRSDVAFDTATITFTYDESMLGDTSEEDLSLMWYDEENHWYQILDRESVVDTVNNTVTYTTTHFSTYFLVDGPKWTERWSSAEYDEWLDNAPSLIGEPVEYVYIWDFYKQFIDPSFPNIYPSYRSFIALSGGFDQIYNTWQGSSYNHEVYFALGSRDPLKVDAFISSTSTIDPLCDGDFDQLVDAMISTLTAPCYSNWTGMVSFVVINDGYFTCSQSTVDKCLMNGFQINVIDYSYPNNSADFISATEQTNGHYYNATYGVNNDLVNREIKESSFQNSGYDGDEDGIADYYEINGMICTNGQVLYSDPDNPHSDNDGLMDGLEVELNTNASAYIGNGSYKTVQYFIEHSDPTKDDTDGDGINDNIDLDPLTCVCVECQINNGYNDFVFLNIDGFDGGNQEWWYSGDNTRKDYWKYLTDVNYRTRCMGCGLIAMSDLELYLTQQCNYVSCIQSSPSYSEDGKICLDEYKQYVNNNRELVYTLSGDLLDYYNGVSTKDIVSGLRLYLNNNGANNILVNWSPSYDSGEILNDIKMMIHMNHPVVFSYFSAKDELKLFSSEAEALRNEESPQYYYRYCMAHYMIIVGYKKVFDENNRLIYLLEVESGGDIYYINYNEYAKKLSWFSNILEYDFQ